MTVNELKMKVMVLGSLEKAHGPFIGKDIEEVEKYEYWDNILSTINTCRVDIFKKNDYLCQQGRKVIFTMKKQLKNVSPFPILLHDNDIRGVNVSVNTPINKLVNFYMSCVPHVKTTMSNTQDSYQWVQTTASRQLHILPHKWFKLS